VLAVELLCAAQALDLLAPLRSSPPLIRVHDFIRAHVAELVGDRSTSNDLVAITELIRTGALERACGVNVN
jgi:histidine ammonia-lyase